MSLFLMVVYRRVVLLFGHCCDCKVVSVIIHTIIVRVCVCVCVCVIVSVAVTVLPLVALVAIINITFLILC